MTQTRNPAEERTQPPATRVGRKDIKVTEKKADQSETPAKKEDQSETLAKVDEPDVGVEGTQAIDVPLGAQASLQGLVSVRDQWGRWWAQSRLRLGTRNWRTPWVAPRGSSSSSRTSSGKRS